ncbi:hypothetical protein EZV73_01545 [Acidaminobacter sp. JC074]|uniref:hypothetical protein n=1 Tax=Acidaminobacter sp. JC074 TaxID=2530199 RepID=UPI001F0F86C7|nr:hypothetical protein [Acidaminobacter sp. JC074]MCH4886228.1 hypothetical protein [Acidaminobacter sp. JC074]
MKKIVIVLGVLLLVLASLLLSQDYETLYLYDGPEEELFKDMEQDFDVFYNGFKKIHKVEIKVKSNMIQELIFTEEIIIPRNQVDVIEKLEAYYEDRKILETYMDNHIRLKYYVSHDKFLAVTSIDCRDLDNEAFIEAFKMDRALSDKGLDYNTYKTTLKEMGFSEEEN